jgi:hypothetical protein
MRMSRDGRRIDLPRVNKHDDEELLGRALIADERNDENVMISQLHASFLALHNRIMNKVPVASLGTDALRYVRARTLVRWAYQYIVANEYLDTVCDPGVAADVRANGPRYFGAPAGRADAFMPLEFSVAAFRFGHSMIRPSYRLNAMTGSPIDIKDLLFPAEGKKRIVETGGRYELEAESRIDWEFFVPGGAHVQFARQFDPRISRGLHDLTAMFGAPPVLQNLAIRNLLRSYLLSVPTGQAMASCFGLTSLTTSQLRPKGAENKPIRDALEQGDLEKRTPLWFYILQEARVQQNGARLGELGSRIVAETIWGLLVNDPGSYIHNRFDPAVSVDGIQVFDGPDGKVSSIGDFLDAARVRP